MKLLLALLFPLLAWAQEPIRLDVDLRGAARKIIHATETIPVRPGPMTLAYPKWIPSEHALAPIEQQAGLTITARGQPLRWRRDPLDLYAFQITIPAGVERIEVNMDFIAASADGGSSTDKLAVLHWNSVLLYPYAGPSTRVADIMVAPSVRLPEGWRHASALQPQGQGAGHTTFRAVSLEQLVDSPLIAGSYFREVALAPEISPPHYLDMVADAPENLRITPARIEELSRLVRQGGALFGARHYDSFRFLLTLSDQIAGGAVDHHQSLDNRRPARFLTDEAMLTRYGAFIPHDFVHSWNGKYRRPEGMATPNFQVPVDGSGLWVVEGLTDYLGSVLAARAGIWSREQYLGMLAESAAWFSHRDGRRWRDLQDTAAMAMVLWEKGGGAYDNLRRNGFDFYGEGGLIWLDVDVAIRNASGGGKSLDDFLARFHGGAGGGPEVRPYSFAQLVTALNGVAPNDWAGFLDARLHSLSAEAPLGGITGGGYRLVYRDQPSAWSAANGSKAFEYSIAMSINNSGGIIDVIDGGIAAQAGFVPGMKIKAVNGQPYTTEAMKLAIRAGQGDGAAIAFSLENGAALRLDYHGGERYPVLERVPGTPDRLAEILLPR